MHNVVVPHLLKEKTMNVRFSFGVVLLPFHVAYPGRSVNLLLGHPVL